MSTFQLPYLPTQVPSQVRQIALATNKFVSVLEISQFPDTTDTTDTTKNNHHHQQTANPTPGIPYTAHIQADVTNLPPPPPPSNPPLLSTPPPSLSLPSQFHRSIYVPYRISSVRYIRNDKIHIQLLLYPLPSTSSISPFLYLLYIPSPLPSFPLNLANRFSISHLIGSFIPE